MTQATTLAANAPLEQKRWAYWLPLVLIESRKFADPAAIFALLQQRHRNRLAACRNMSLATAAILDCELDDPRLAEDAWEFAFQGAIERRRLRMGRRPGVYSTANRHKHRNLALSNARRKKENHPYADKP